ncbi:hypothetical protein ACJ41O_009377 [Fusarium nematophilum]
MADSKSKGVNGNHHPVEKSPTKQQSKLWQLLALAKEVSKDVESIQDFEKSAEGRKALEQELEAKQGENQRLREFNDKIVRDFSEHKAQANAKTETLFAEFEQKYKAYETGKAAVEAMEKEVAEMREKLSVSDARTGEVDKLKQRLQSAEVHAKNHAAEIREMNAECELQRSRMQASIEELDGCKAKLGQAQSDLGEGILRDFGPEAVEKLRLDLADLIDKIHALVNDNFSDPDAAADSASEIQELSARFPNIPLSTRTTRAAVKMRCAVADAVIAETLMSHIFVPFYVPNEVKATASAMLDFFEGDERRQTVYRCQILGSSSSDPEQADKIREDVVRKASNEVRSTLHPLVVAYKQAGFYNAVPALFRQAVSLWADVQRSRELVAAEMPDEEHDRLSGEHEGYDFPDVVHKKGSKGHGNAKAKTLAVLFPQVVRGGEVLLEATVLTSTQGAVVEAKEEMTANGTNGEVKKRAGTRRRSSAEAPVRGR